MTDNTGDGEVALGLEFVRRLGGDEMSLPEIVDAVEEAVGDRPRVVREVVERAEEEGLIREVDGVGEGTPATYSVGNGSGTGEEVVEVVAREGEFGCERCGRGLSTGYFVVLEHGEVGPYGPTCVRRVTGKDEA